MDKLKVQLKIGGEEKELDWVEKENYRDSHFELGGEDFDGHRVLWSFSYEPHTYLKESELSGEEWRKGGWIKYFRNGIQVYEQFWRDPETAPIQIARELPKIMEFDWERLKEGKKIFYRDTPAIISRIILDQGSVIIDVDGVERFPDHVWAKEDWEKLEDPTSVKDDIFSPHIWWFRRD